MFHASFRTAQSSIESPRIIVSGPATSLGVSLSFHRHCSVPFLVSVLGITNRNSRQSPTQPWYFLWQEVFSSALVSGIGKGLVFPIRKFSNHQTPIRGCRSSDYHIITTHHMTFRYWTIFEVSHVAKEWFASKINLVAVIA